MRGDGTQRQRQLHPLLSGVPPGVSQKVGGETQRAFETKEEGNAEMKITMLGTRRGCEDGFAVMQYHKGETYDMADTQARDFVQKGWAKEAHSLCIGGPLDGQLLTARGEFRI